MQPYVSILNTLNDPDLVKIETLAALQCHHCAESVTQIGSRVLVFGPRAHLNELESLSTTWISHFVDLDLPDIPTIYRAWIKRGDTYHTYDGKSFDMVPSIDNRAVWVTNSYSVYKSGRQTLEVLSFLEMIFPWFSIESASLLERYPGFAGISGTLDDMSAMAAPIQTTLMFLHRFAIEQIAPVLNALLNIADVTGRRAGDANLLLGFDGLSPIATFCRSRSAIHSRPQLFYWYRDDDRRTPKAFVCSETEFVIYSIDEVLVDMYGETRDMTPSWLKFRIDEEQFLQDFNDSFLNNKDVLDSLIYVGFGCIVSQGPLTYDCGGRRVATSVRPIMTASSVMCFPGRRGFWAVRDISGHRKELFARGTMAQFAYNAANVSDIYDICQTASFTRLGFLFQVNPYNANFLQPRGARVPMIGDRVTRYWSPTGFVETLDDATEDNIPTLP